tara:strand:+ start:66 stop:287 length:222 start_codon:yes stop_codon:yes gene_type:complete
MNGRYHSPCSLEGWIVLKTDDPKVKGFVYFIRNKDIYKIGITENTLRRFDQLKPDEVINVVKCFIFKNRLNQK